MPGWELTQGWMTEDGLPQRGIVNIQYFSGEGKKKFGCSPNVDFRLSLLKLVLIEEKELVEEVNI